MFMTSVNKCFFMCLYDGLYLYALGSDISPVAEFVHKYCAAPVGIPLRVFRVRGGIWPVPPPPPRPTHSCPPTRPHLTLPPICHHPPYHHRHPALIPSHPTWIPPYQDPFNRTRRRQRIPSLGGSHRPGGDSTGAFAKTQGTHAFQDPLRKKDN